MFRGSLDARIQVSRLAMSRIVSGEPTPDSGTWTRGQTVTDYPVRLMRLPLHCNHIIMAMDNGKHSPIMATDNGEQSPTMATDNSEQSPITATDNGMHSPIMTTDNGMQSPIMATDKGKHSPIMATDNGKHSPIVPTDNSKHSPLQKPLRSVKFLIHCKATLKKCK